MYEVRIERVVAGGHGLTHVDGAVCFVPYGLPGDRVALAEVRKRRGVLHGRIDALLEPSPDRRETACPVFGRCGGCTWLHFAYPAQGEWKREIVAESFQRIAKTEVEVGWAEEPALRLGYRTRATFHMGRGACGFYAAGSRTIVDIAECPLCHPRLNAALRTLREQRCTGSFELTVNPEGDEVLLWTRGPSRALRRAFPMTNSSKDAQARFQFAFDGVPVVNGTFSQGSLLLNRKLVSVVREALEECGSVLDLYCGSGNFTRGLGADRHVLGLDRNRAAVEAADSLRPGSYRVGDERAFQAALSERHWDAVLLDPPRQGARALMPALARSRAGRIVYVSCDPATLARDSRTLIEAGWTVQRATAVDMFPNTPHVETVVVFTREGQRS